METRSDNFKKVPVGPKAKKSREDTRIKKKITATNLERHTASGERKKEIPQLTPLHRLKKFQVIRDRNLKNKGFKTSLENKIKKMEGVTAAATVEVKEKVVVKETIEEVVISNTNGIENLDKDITDLKNMREKNKSPPKDENHLSLRLEEVTSEENTTEKNELKDDQVELKSKSLEISKKSEPIQDNNIESNIETEDTNKNVSGGVPENDAVSSVSSQPANNNSSPGPTDDEDEVEVIESKPLYESNSTENKLNSTKEEEREDTNDVSYRSFKESAVSYKASLNASAASSYKSSYSNPSRIYGRRPVRGFTRSRKRKMEEETVQNSDFKRTNSPSQPSPRWRFFPSTMNFWTPRTTPFIFSSTTPMKNLNDSMTVNIDEDTIRNDLDDSDLFSDADDFTPQPAKKTRWGCAIM